MGLDAATGDECWRETIPLGAWSTLAGDELLYVDSRKSRLERRDSETGALRGSIKLRDRIVGDVQVLAVRDGVLWVQSVARGNGKPLRAFDVVSGELVASAEITWSDGPAIAITAKRVIVNERATARDCAALCAYVNPFSPAEAPR